MKCDPGIYKNGTQVAILQGGTAKYIELFIREVARVSGQPVDWHYAGGRARVLTTGDIERVMNALEASQILMLF